MTRALKSWCHMYNTQIEWMICGDNVKNTAKARLIKETNDTTTGMWIAEWQNIMVRVRKKIPMMIAGDWRSKGWRNLLKWPIEHFSTGYLELSWKSSWSMLCYPGQCLDVACYCHISFHRPPKSLLALAWQRQFRSLNLNPNRPSVFPKPGFVQEFGSDIAAETGEILLHWLKGKGSWIV